MRLDVADPVAVAVADAVRGGDTGGLRRLLAAHPGLATARIADGTAERTLLHVVADWPGHRPNGAETVAVLVAAGADPDARLVGPHRETPLHWAAGCDDVSDAFWNACHGGRRETAAYLWERGADPHRVPAWEPLTPLQAAQRSGAGDVVAWLRATLSGTP